jgi:hypothetical protein
MSRRPPFTQAELEKRERLGLGPVLAKPVAGHVNFKCLSKNGQQADKWDFSDALNVLGITNARLCVRLTQQLKDICKCYELIRLAESQETPASKAAALEIALKRARQQIAAGKSPTMYDPQRPDHARLPAMLEMEVGAEMRQGSTLETSLVAVQARYRRAIKPGRKASIASQHTIQALEAWAAQYKPELDWLDLKNQRRLKNFVLAVLEAAKIKHPDPEENASKFNKLRTGYTPPAVDAKSRRPRISRAEKEQRLAEFNARFDRRIRKPG